MEKFMKLTITTSAASGWTRFTGVSARVTLALIFLGVAFIGGCKEEVPGIVTVCVVPTVTRTSPPNFGTDESLSKTSGHSAPVVVEAVKEITATFSTPMDPKSITNASFTVRQGANTIDGTVWYSDTTAVFIAPNGLGPNLLYTCTVTTGAKDLAGTAMARNYVWSFTTVAAGTPALTAPLNGSANLATNPTLIWNAVDGADMYRLQVSLSPGFVSTVYDDSNIANTSQQVTGLFSSSTYYWRVNADISGGTGPYSAAWHFTTLGAPDAPVLTAPVAAAQNQSTNPTLSWLSSVGAATYRVQVSTSDLFAVIVLDDSNLTGTSQAINGLMIGTTYYWRVDAKNTAGTSAYATQSFTTAITAFQPPILAAPTDSATNSPVNPILSWNASSGAMTYRVQVDTSALFTHPVVDDSTISGLSRSVIGLTVGKTYYWHVDAKNLTGTTGYSATWLFTVAAVASQPINLGTMATFGSIGGSAGITNQGIFTKVNGSLGTTGSSTLVTGFHDNTAPPSNVFTETPLNIGAVSDTIYTATAPPGSVAGAVARQSLADAQTAYNTLKLLPGGPDPKAGELGGLTLAPGTYTAANGSFKISLVDLTLDGKGDANARFVFQMASSLTVGSAGPTGARSVILINGAQAKNVYWITGTGGSGAATINGSGGGTMVGTIIAYSGVSFSTAGNTILTHLEGRAVSLIGGVTMVNTIIDVPLP